jgi:hypothetical protein
MLRITNGSKCRLGKVRGPPVAGETQDANDLWLWSKECRDYEKLQ